MPNPILWAILSGLLRFVPYIGSSFRGLAHHARDSGRSGLVHGNLDRGPLYLVELGVSQGVEPILYGHTRLSPLAVVISAIFWSWLWGSIGLVLSMPLTLCLVVLGKYVDWLEFLDIMLGDRPPLTPVESFYQRILAGDADEAQDHAELLLKVRSLPPTTRVALKGLQLAANDAERGVIRQRQLERVRNTINSLIREFAEHGDQDPLSRDIQRAGTPKDPRDMKQFPAQKYSKYFVFRSRGKGQLPSCALPGGGRSMSGLRDVGTTSGKAWSGHTGQIQRSFARRHQLLDVTGIAMICVAYLDIRAFLRIFDTFCSD